MSVDRGACEHYGAELRMRMMLYQPRAWLIWRSSFALGSKCISIFAFSSTHRLATERAPLGFEYLVHHQR